ncbi:hypothetical protein [Halorubrum vacuolatum]|uniref:Uncharacterized protein n=1 Tax=Halorubrum vacuolatum TaxID=63740 RepID=A0A238YCZ8_HALVU|nr:hypothetical protein [Halorubrum vacuolatum]SNR68219.1 hypothetical protein SAMN06264855_1363 [Halorubrum vacuolatum]
MHRFEKIDLGTYRGDNYFLVGYVEPDPNDQNEYDPAEDAENYGWSLVQKAESPIDENDEIVGMDTRHDQPHLDKEYLPSDADEEKKVWLDDDYSFKRMREYLLEHWRAYADLHIYYNE